MKLNTSSTNIVKRLLTGRPSRPLRSLLKRIEVADLASLLTQLNTGERKTLIEGLVNIRKIGPVLCQIPEHQLSHLLHQMDHQLLSETLEISAIHDSAFILSHMDEEQRAPLLQEMKDEQRTLLLQYLNYPEGSAGRMMATHFFSVPDHITAQQGLELLRQKSQEESLYYIYCTNEDSKLVGVVSLRVLATAPPETPIEKLAKKEIVFVHTDTPSEKVAQLVSHYDFIALPVLDSQDRMAGIITVDDVVDIIQEQALAKMYARAGLQEDDRVYSTVIEKVKNRLPWMILNLALSGIASLVVYQFEGILNQLVILAVTKNIVASTSGNTAIQSLTVVTRGIATNDFQFISYAKAFFREFLVGCIIGLFMGTFAGFFLYFMMGDSQHSLMVGAVMLISMVLTSMVGSCAGAGVPYILNSLNRDPAVASGVLVTVITDIFGFFSFLGLATLAMKFL
jgi:magnesium transporter